MIDTTFMGKNGFVWWFGKVVSNADPLGIGRCRVRIVGWHNDNPDVLPDTLLPWAVLIQPSTTSGVGGVGVTPVGPVPGTRVFGFFLDGEMGMQPAIIGVISGKTPAGLEAGKLEYGSTTSYPNLDDLIAPIVLGTEDCPTGYSTENSTINLSIPDARDIEINKSEWSVPFTGFVSSAYAERSGNHNGVDISPAGFYKQETAGASHVANKLLGPTGLPVFAAADGEVVYVWTADKGQRGVSTNYDKTGHGSRSYGNAVAIRHSLSTGVFTTIYAHLGINQDPGKDKYKAGIFVSVGDKVKKGQQIGTVGRTHNFSQLTHLHFEIRVGDDLPKNNNHINPGRIFPQLYNRHQPIINWCLTRSKYNEEPIYNPLEAPVIAKDGPK